MCVSSCFNECVAKEASGILSSATLFHVSQQANAGQAKFNIHVL